MFPGLKHYQGMTLRETREEIAGLGGSEFVKLLRYLREVTGREIPRAPTRVADVVWWAVGGIEEQDPRLLDSSSPANPRTPEEPNRTRTTPPGAGRRTSIAPPEGWREYQLRLLRDLDSRETPRPPGGILGEEKLR